MLHYFLTFCLGLYSTFVSYKDFFPWKFLGLFIQNELNLPFKILIRVNLLKLILSEEKGVCYDSTFYPYPFKYSRYENLSLSFLLRKLFYSAALIQCAKNTNSGRLEALSYITFPLKGVHRFNWHVNEQKSDIFHLINFNLMSRSYYSNYVL